MKPQRLHSLQHAVAPGRRWQLLAACMASLALLLASCTSTHTSSSATKPGSGIAEYRQLTSEATTAVLRAINYLERLEVQTNSCPSKLTIAFDEEVHRLQTDSLRVRARAQAILARGDAYFEAWSEGLIPTNSPASGPAAEHVSRMQASFATIKLASQQAGDSFRPFLANLRQLRTSLETNAGMMGTKEGKELVLTTRVRGQEAVHYLGVINKELDVLAREFKAAQSTTKL